MLTFKFIPRAKQFVVFGPPEEMRLGLVKVARDEGAPVTEQIIKLGTVFQTEEGPRQYGYIAVLPRTPSSKPKITDRPQRFPVTVRRVEPT